MSSLQKALKILDLFSPARSELGVSDAARQTTLPKSSVSRLMAEMAQFGLLETDSARGRYRPGVLAFRLGAVYQSHTSLVDLADRAIGDLAERFGVTGYVSILDKTNVVVLRMRHGRTPLRTILSEPGSSELAVNTAAGRALLAHMDAEALESVIPEHFQSNENRRVRRREFLKLLETVRVRGWADAEYLDGQIGAVATAVIPHEEMTRPLALSLSFSTRAIHSERRRQMIAELQRCAMALGERVRANVPLSRTDRVAEAAGRAASESLDGSQRVMTPRVRKRRSQYRAQT